VTEDEERARKYQQIEEAQRLKDHLNVLEKELEKFVKSWMALGHEASRGWMFQIDENGLKMLNPSQDMYEVANVPWEHLDSGKVKHLFGDIQQTRDELAEAKKGLRSLGISLSVDSF
jgi:hypothetical protein